MSILNDLVNRLLLCVKNTAPICELEIRQFAEKYEIFLRDDHFDFLMRLGPRSDERIRIFRWYEGDFDFLSLKRVYIENHLEMELPPGATYFGSNFAGDSFCVDNDSGGIFVYDEGQKYGLVHETIDGFLLRCLFSVYNEEAFSNKIVKRDLAPANINDFQLINKDKKIVGATSFDVEYETIGGQRTIDEYYFIDDQLIALYPSTKSLVAVNGGILENLKS